MKTDEIIDQLLAKVELKKKEIKNLERPSWKTSCTLGFDSSPNKTNIQTVKDVGTIVGLYSNLLSAEDSWAKASKELGVTEKQTIGGYSVKDWKLDLKTRIDQIQIEAKKKELKDFEDKLNGLISPEKRRELELAALAKALE